ncbi:MAG: rhodanese-like domain-containing protein [Acidobacteriota bacterium]
MKMRTVAATILFCTSIAATGGSQPAPDNPAIDMSGYLRTAQEAAQYRTTHRLSEDDFIRMSHEPGTIVLDARSAGRYNELHVRGAINLSFPDLTIDSLKSTIPDPDTRILIYCNNNFRGAEGPFPSKLPAASLNLSTFIALYTYGYRNIYELGPLLDLKSSRLSFEAGSGLFGGQPAATSAEDTGENYHERFRR